MPRRLNGRLRHLENGRVRPCEECGFDGAWSGVEVAWEDHGTFDPADLKRCGTCGTQLEYILTWDDIPPEWVIAAREEI